MLKTYELTDRHFGWTAWPKPATERQILDNLIDAALRTRVHGLNYAGKNTILLAPVPRRMSA
jgi:hypothetical protein